MTESKLQLVTEFLGRPLLTTNGQPSVKPRRCVLFLHGAIDTGEGMQEAVNLVSTNDFNLPETIIFYPSAPAMFYDFSGSTETVWHNRKDLSPFVPEHSASIENMGRSLANLVEEIEVKMGVSPANIVIGGFSQGGHMALHLAYRFLTVPVAGVFCISSFLAEGSVVYECVKSAIESSKVISPLFMAHGTLDKNVPHSWGETTFNRLKSCGLKVKFSSYDVQHSLHPEELSEVKAWIWERLK